MNYEEYRTVVNGCLDSVCDLLKSIHMSHSVLTTFLRDINAVLKDINLGTLRYDDPLYYDRFIKLDLRIACVRRELDKLCDEENEKGVANEDKLD